VKVWFDNDLAGRNAAVKVGNSLAAAGLPIRVYHWRWSAKPKEDLADVILDEIRARVAA
jgi:DNA primase